MSVAMSAASAIVFVWVGLVAGISFIEAPLKFRAPGVTVRIGLGIGRLVFRVVNSVEAVLAAALMAILLVEGPALVAFVPLLLAVLVLVLQLVFVRPRLSRRSDAVLAGAAAPRSHAHLLFVALEVVKTIALLSGGIAVLATG